MEKTSRMLYRNTAWDQIALHLHHVDTHVDAGKLSHSIRCRALGGNIAENPWLSNRGRDALESSDRTLFLSEVTLDS